MAEVGRAVVLAGLAGALAGSAAAQDAGRASDRALAPLVACKATADPRARAGCYDAALDHLQAQVAQRQVVIMDREQVAVDRKAQFGFVGEPHPPKPPRPAHAPKSERTAAAPTEEVASIDSTVTSASPYGYDQWVIRIATGATWRTTEAVTGFQPKGGQEIHIRRGIMNGYMIKVGKAGRPVRAIRIG